MDTQGKPIEFLLKYYDIELMEEFEIINMADSPYHFNNCGSLCNRDNKVRDELLNTLLTEPKWFKRCRKMWSGINMRIPSLGAIQAELSRRKELKGEGGRE